MLNRLPLLLICLYVISTVHGQQRQTFSCEQDDMINKPDTSLWHLSLSEFVKQSSLVKPKITGGSVTLVSAVNGTSLIMMSLQISKSKIKDITQLRSMDSILTGLQAKQHVLACLAEKDNIVFRNYLSISKLPANTDSERKHKDSLRAESLIQATDLPLEGAETILQCLRNTHEIVKLFNKNVFSDVAAGCLVIAASLDGLVLMANSNITGLSEDLKSVFLMKSEALSKSSKVELSAIMENIKIRN